MPNKFRPEFLIGGIILMGLAGSGAILASQSGEVSRETTMDRPYVKRAYAEIVNPSGFVNTERLALKDIVGKKVVLLDFMTYSCINCQRTFPYLNEWYGKYKDAGLEIVAIHTPEFAFEKDIDNVRQAMQTYDIEYPVVLDNDYATWRAYGNKYWPRKYLIDIHGNIVYDHIGEGAYQETEAKIVELLRERADVLGETVAIPQPSGEDEASLASRRAQSPEVYFGSDRNELLGNGQAGYAGVQSFTAPARTQRNTLYLDGSWFIHPEYAESRGESSVKFRYSGQEVFFVAESEEGAVIEVWQDGVRVGEVAGSDVEGGTLRIRDSRLYKLIRNPSFGEHELELRVKEGSVRAYTFTFG